MDKDYWEIKIPISTNTRNQLRTGLKTYNILESAWNSTSLDIEIFILVKKNFVDFIVRIMPNNKCKINVNFLLCNKTYLFTYNIKITELRQFPDSEIFYVDNFQVFISITIEVQLQA